MRTLIKRLVVEGFGAIQSPLLFDLDRSGVWLIKGDNGAGKTTMFSALCWCLFQVNLKGTVNDKVATWERKRTEDFQGTRVIVTMEIGSSKYMFARHLGYKGKTIGLSGASRLMIFKKDLADSSPWVEKDLVGDELDKKGMQTYINDLLGIDAKTFVNSILFGQRMKRLVESDNDEKRELLEKLFELSFIAEAKERAKTKYLKVVGLITEANTQEANLTQTIKDKTEVAENYDEILKNFASDKKLRVQTEKSNLTDLEIELDTLNEKMTLASGELAKLPKIEDDERTDYNEQKVAYQKVLDRLNELKKEKSEHDTEIRNADKSIAKLNTDYNEVKDTCYACNQPLKPKDVEVVKNNIKAAIKKEEDAKSIIEFALPKLDESIKKVGDSLVLEEEKLETLRKKYANVDLDKEKYQNKLREIGGIQKEIDSLITSIDRQKKRIADEEAKKKPDLKVEAIRAEIATAEKSKEEWAAKKVRYEYLAEKLKWWNTTGFGSNGLKSFVFTAMLSNLNHFVQRYVSRFGVGVEFSIDLTKASKPFITKCYMEGIEVDYNELSGGEKQRIDIALAFAMHDLVSMGASFNILILDELFEGLDQNGVEVAFDLIRLKAGDDKAVYIVTHSQIIDSLNTKTIELKKSKQGTFINE